ncbi:MAG: glycine oxidase ThiO [Acidobacteriota bacterium]|nr:glycine oxidase ThiO [Acidobacteriota bacterium]
MVKTKSADVVVVGAGVIGCAVAYHLAKVGVSVLVLERGRVGREASWASAGILTHARPASTHPYERLATLSRSLFEPLVQELIELSGVDPEYRPSGGVHVFLDDEGVERARNYYRGSVLTGLEVEFLEPADLFELEPALNREARAAIRFPGDGSIRPPRLVRALSLAAQRLGTRILEHSPVVEMKVRSGRVTDILTPEERIHGGRFVLATGAWSGLVGDRVGVNLPVYSSKGEIVLLESLPGKLGQIVNNDGHYLVPRSDGKLLVGATEETVGFDKTSTVHGVLELLKWAYHVAPGLSDATFVTSWAGLRPAVRRGGPFLGRLKEFENLYVATAHNSNGMLLSAASGLLMSQLLTNRPTSLALEPFAVPETG